MEQINLKDIVQLIQNSYIMLNKEFLHKLLKNASNSEKPHMNEEFAIKLGCNFNRRLKMSTIIRGWIFYGRTVPINKLIKILEFSNCSWSDVESNVLGIKTSKSTKGLIHIRFPIAIGKELGSIVGHILGDGSIDKKYTSVFFSNTNIDLLKEFYGYMFNIFQVKPRIWVQELCKFEERRHWIKRVYSLNEIPESHPVGLFYPKTCASVLYAIFGKFAFGDHKELTKQILDSPRECKKAIIRAFFDDEGSITPKSYTIRVFQDKKEILEDISKMLTSFDIEPNCVKYYEKRNKKRFYFNITGYSNFIKFKENIGFSSPDKNKKLILMIDRVGKSVSFRLRNNKSKKEILEILRNKHMLTTNGIAKELRQKYTNMKWANTSVNRCLSKLKAENLVKSRYINNNHFWCLT